MAETKKDRRQWLPSEVWLEHLDELRADAEGLAKAERRGRFDLGKRLELFGKFAWLLAPSVDPETVIRSCEVSALVGLPVLALGEAAFDRRAVVARDLLEAAAGKDLGPAFSWPITLLPHPRLAEAIVRPPDAAHPLQPLEPAGDVEALEPEQPAAADLEAQAPEPPADPAPIDPEPPAAPPVQALESAADGEWVPGSALAGVCPYGRSANASMLYIKRHGGPDVRRQGPGGWLYHRERARQLLGARRPNQRVAAMSDEQRQAHRRELRKRWASRQPKQQHADAEREPDGLDALLAAVRSDAEG